MPWEEIEKRKISARRYITSSKPMRQQIAIALELLKKQKMRTPLGKNNQPRFKPLLFVIAISIKDAENIAKEIERIGSKYNVNKVLVVHNEQEEEKKEEARNLNKNHHPEIDVVVSVMMLREGWDVRNISIELLFRKFSYKQVGDKRFSVYGPQVIGRGLRRMNKSNEEWESLYVVDHPILKHQWLWEDLKATQYPESIDPANIIIDEEKIAEEKTEAEFEEEKTLDDAERLDLSKIPPTPEPKEVVEPILEWQKFLDDYRYEFNRMNISQEITQIKSLNLDSEHVSLQKDDLPEVSVDELQKATETENWGKDELVEELKKQIYSIARSALIEYDRNPDERTVYLIRIIKTHIAKRFLFGKDIEEAEEKPLRILWAMIDQVRDVFLRPELIEGIFTKNDLKKR
jgi:superfamily II DNA or RNA helicase